MERVDLCHFCATHAAKNLRKALDTKDKRPERINSLFDTAIKQFRTDAATHAAGVPFTEGKVTVDLGKVEQMRERILSKAG